jgi:hypothetical protein
MKTWGSAGSGGIASSFLTSALDGDEWGFTPRLLYAWGKNPGIHWIGGWVGPRAGLDAVENSKNLTPARN